jgi:uncharacterized protein
MISRRQFLKTPAVAASFGLGGYSVAIEPNYFLNVTRYVVTPAGWPPGFTLKIAALADLHASEPWMPAERIARIADATNALKPDLIALLGDFSGGTVLAAPVAPKIWGAALSRLKAPLGVHAVLGNHDWDHGPLPQDPADDAEGVRNALRGAGAFVHENDVIRLAKDGAPFWLLGLGDQISGVEAANGDWISHDDLPATLAKIGDDAPAILLAHEPMIFDSVPRRVALTLCGHTHGGQVYPPLIGEAVATRQFGKNHFYGHVVEDERHMIVSAGLGVSKLPLRLMRPPEIVEVTIGAPLPVA